jgi:hypothetical protein
MDFGRLHRQLTPHSMTVKPARLALDFCEVVFLVSWWWYLFPGINLKVIMNRRFTTANEKLNSHGAAVGRDE